MAQFSPRLHNDVYPFIYPAKFRSSLKDKVVIITGSVGSIGQAHAESFAVAGARLFLVYNKTSPPSRLQERCMSFGASSVTFIKCDLSDFQACENLVEEVVRTVGRVDILVNNAGSNGLGSIYKQDPKDFLKDMSINFNGPYLLIRLLMPHFVTQKSGCVINIASRAGTLYVPYSASYATSKAALINLTGCIQKEMDIEGYDDIHLYSLHPGGVKSTMVLNKYSEEAMESSTHIKKLYSGILDLYNDSPYLSAMTSVALATGIAKDALKGRYFDVHQNLEDVIAQTDIIQADPELYSLHTSFLGDLSNAVGESTMMFEKTVEQFTFPGF